VTNHTPFDSGLPAERTLLAWRRTALAVAVVSAVAIRFTAPTIGWVAVAGGAVGVALALIAYIGMAHRYRHVHRTLHQTARHPATGWPTTTLALAALLLGFAALGYVLHLGTSGR
jgi:uncharacterized membrane protein YidH (DUF202 family)